MTQVKILLVDDEPLLRLTVSNDLHDAGKHQRRIPVMLMVKYQYSVIAPDNIGTESAIVPPANFIFKNPFGDQ